MEDIRKSEEWPELPLEEWKDTCATLHMWTQVVGKVRLAQTPLVNHWWNVPLYVSPRGLTTSAMPYKQIFFEMEFDFLDHRLVIECSDGGFASVDLKPKSVAVFYREVMETLRQLGLGVRIWKMPVEISNPIPFDQDDVHAAYDPEYVNRFWHVLLQTDKVLQEFRARFIGKCSPVHFFWGSFDLAVTSAAGCRSSHARGLFARSYQSWLLAWPGDAWESRVLFLHCTCAAGAGPCEHSTTAGHLQQ